VPENTGSGTFSENPDIYSLSRSGRRRLEKETADWQRFTAAVQQVLRTT
jgi:hypothetical protein